MFFPRFRFWLLALALAVACGEVCAQSPLTSIPEIRALPRTTPPEGVPVKVRCVVTYCSARVKSGLVVENDGEGIYVDGGYAAVLRLAPVNPLWPKAFERGRFVEIEGVAMPGHFAPIIVPRTVEVIGTAPLPEPAWVTIADLLDGRYDCRRVRLRGVVQYVANATKQTGARLDLVALGGRIVVNVENAPADLTDLMDAEIELTGVMYTYFNGRGELVGAQAQATDSGDIRVIERSGADPFAAQRVSLENLRPFSRTGATFHRRVCTGTVTFARPGEFFYMQEGNRGVRVETRDRTDFQPGDRVEASGFVEVAVHFGRMREAVVRKIGTAPMPVPMPIARKRVLGSNLQGFVTDAEDTDGRFATLRGRLEKVDAADVAGPRLIVESEGALISVTLNRDFPPAALAKLERDSEVQLTGVIQVELASGWPAQEYPKPINFRLFVRSPAEISVLRVAPWWTAQRLWYALSGTVVLLALALAWSARLQRRVTQRNAQLAEAMQARREASVEFQATLRERERLAADLHDTLEQALTGIAFRLETMVVRRSKTMDYSEDLDRVRQLLASTREDVRRSVWNLRVKALEGRTLPEALQTAADRLAAGSDLVVAIETEGEPWPLPDLISGNLLLLGMEAMTNAVKHADPRSIHLRVLFEKEALVLVVEDDGRGFDPERAAGPGEGHFGVQGMRERIKRLGGSLEVVSSPGKGTRITATLPMRGLMEPVKERAL